MDLATSSDAAKRVLIAGTYHCHPVPMGVAILVLKKLSAPKVAAPERLERLARRLEEGPKKVFRTEGFIVATNRTIQCILRLFHGSIGDELVGLVEWSRFRVRCALPPDSHRSWGLPFSSAVKTG